MSSKSPVESDLFPIVPIGVVVVCVRDLHFPRSNESFRTNKEVLFISFFFLGSGTGLMFFSFGKLTLRVGLSSVESRA